MVDFPVRSVSTYLIDKENRKLQDSSQKHICKTMLPCFSFCSASLYCSLLLSFCRLVFLPFFLLTTYLHFYWSVIFYTNKYKTSLIHTCLFGQMHNLHFFFPKNYNLSRHKHYVPMMNRKGTGRQEREKGMDGEEKERTSEWELVMILWHFKSRSVVRS